MLRAHFLLTPTRGFWDFLKKVKKWDFWGVKIRILTPQKLKNFEILSHFLSVKSSFLPVFGTPPTGGSQTGKMAKFSGEGDGDLIGPKRVPRSGPKPISDPYPQKNFYGGL